VVGILQECIGSDDNKVKKTALTSLSYVVPFIPEFLVTPQQHAEFVETVVGLVLTKTENALDEVKSEGIACLHAFCESFYGSIHVRWDHLCQWIVNVLEDELEEEQLKCLAVEVWGTLFHQEARLIQQVHAFPFPFLSFPFLLPPSCVYPYTSSSFRFPLNSLS